MGTELKITSISSVPISGWEFKVSSSDYGIMLIAHNTQAVLTSVRFFEDESDVKDFINLLILKTENLKLKS
jgi:hypothetical protein